ncbi:MAG TPA: M56 family metallopeptidase [Pirellulales bacterium]|nr:M56 family metallopeptidase [Pirellulales bacterium]
MTWLVAIGLTNAAIASVLACVAWGVGRVFRRPALSRLLWIVVLCKLLAPPLAKGPEWLAVPSRWLAETSPATLAEATAVTTLDVATVAANTPPAESRDRLASADQNSTNRSSPQAVTTEPPGGIGTASREVSQPREAFGQTGFRRFLAASPADCLRWAAIVWICGSVLCTGRLVYRSWRFRSFLARAGREAPDLSAKVSRLAKSAGLRSAPRVMVVESVVSPMLWGAGRTARLLFPAELMRRIDDDACDALLLHELAHYARGDWRVRVLELAAHVVYWWHPLVWWARHEIEAAEEECCDAWVLHRQDASRRTYAEALLTTLDFLCEPIGSLPPAACGLGAAPLLRSRLTKIMCGEVAIHNSRRAKAAVLAASLVVLPWGPAFVKRPSQEATAREVATGNTISLDGASDETLASALPLNALDAGPAAEPVPAAELRSGSWFVPPSPLPPLGPALYATAVSPNGKHKLEARAGYRATLIDVESDRHLDLSSYRIRSASFSPDSRRLVTAQEDDNVVRLWDSSSGELLARLTGSQVAVSAVAFAPDGKRVAAGAEDGSVLVWALDDREQVARWPQQDAPVSSLRWSQQGDRLAIALSSWSNRDSSSIVVWRPDDARDVQSWSLEQSIGAIDWLSPDELVVADWDGAAKTVDLATGLVAGNQWLSKDAVSGAFFSPDCPLLPRWRAGRLARVGD